MNFVLQLDYFGLGAVVAPVVGQLLLQFPVLLGQQLNFVQILRNLLA